MAWHGLRPSGPATTGRRHDHTLSLWTYLLRMSRARAVGLLVALILTASSSHANACICAPPTGTIILDPQSLAAEMTVLSVTKKVSLDGVAQEFERLKVLRAWTQTKVGAI